MKHPNNMVQMNILGPFYLNSSSERNYIKGCLDDCSRNVASRWSKRRGGSVDYLEDWIMVNGRPDKIIHDNRCANSSKILQLILIDLVL